MTMARRQGWLIAAGCAVAMLFLPTSADALKGCVDGKGERALNARVLQIELMVGAIQCGNKSLYKSFYRKYRSQLQSEGRFLQELYRKDYGGRGKSEVEKLKTRLANQAARRASVNRGSYCQQNKQLFNEALAAGPGDFPALAEKANGLTDHGIPRCSASAGGFGAAKAR